MILESELWMFLKLCWVSGGIIKGIKCRDKMLLFELTEREFPSGVGALLGILCTSALASRTTKNGLACSL